MVFSDNGYIFGGKHKFLSFYNKKGKLINKKSVLSSL